MKLKQLLTKGGGGGLPSLAAWSTLLVPGEIPPSSCAFTDDSSAASLKPLLEFIHMIRSCSAFVLSILLLSLFPIAAFGVGEAPTISVPAILDFDRSYDFSGLDNLGNHVDYAVTATEISDGKVTEFSTPDGSVFAWNETSNRYDGEGDASDFHYRTLSDGSYQKIKTDDAGNETVIESGGFSH